MKRQIIDGILYLCALCLLAACGTKKAVVSTQTTTQPETQTAVGASEAVRKLTFVQKVYDCQLYQKNIVGSMSFNIKAGDKEHTLPGSLHMRKDEVIRLQVFIPLLGSEVGRIEFTPDYVLVVDRIHKEYIKADYNQLDFLKKNGLSFYSLQSLFWNQLLVPGVQKVTDAELRNFDADLNADGNTIPVKLTHGKMTYNWNASKTDGKILSALVEYNSTDNGKSTLTWDYSDFKPVGVKMFPATQSFTFTTSANHKKQSGTVTFSLDEIGTDSKWESTTTVSPKYKKVEAQDVFDKLLKM